MALKKQTIRNGVSIMVDGEVQTKEQLITLSGEWSENQENIFRKMLKQGGNFKIKGKSFEISLEDRIVTSRGEKDGGVKQVPGVDDRF